MNERFTYNDQECVRMISKQGKNAFIKSTSEYIKVSLNAVVDRKGLRKKQQAYIKTPSTLKISRILLHKRLDITSF